MKIDNKVAVVLGGSGGIGRAYCEALLAKGAKVMLGGVQNELGEQTVAEFCQEYGEGRAVFHNCDNTNDDQVKGLFKNAVTTFGIPDIFVHNAAIVNEFKWEQMLAVNMGGLIRCCNEALRVMSKANGGQGGVIVNTCSIGSLRPLAWGPVYAATKYAGLGFTLSWGQPENVAVTVVRFNCICPTTVNTRLLKNLGPEFVHGAEGLQDAIKTSPKLEPEYVAQGLNQLVEDDALSAKALRVTSALGFDFAEFQDTPAQ